MNSIHKLVLVGLLVVAGGLVSYLFRAREAPPPVAAPAAPAAAVEPAVDALQARLADAEAEVARLRAEADRPPAPIAEAAPMETAPEEPEEDEKPWKQKQKRMMEAQMGIMTDMVYTPYFEQVSLSETEHDAARTILAEGMGKAHFMAQKAMKEGSATAQEIKQQTDEIDAWVASELETILSKDAYAAYEEYADYKDQILYEALLDGQLRMLAPGLETDSHELTMNVFAKELETALNAFHESPRMYTLDNYNQAQSQGLHAGLDQLESAMPADQFQHAAGFVKQVDVMFDALKDQPETP